MTKPFETEGWLAPTEGEEGEPPRPQPPAERVGYAVVGLGELAEAEVLPALEGSERSRLAALVTGDKAKAETLARRYGLEPGSVYSYGEFDRIADDPDVGAVYIILPNAQHLEFTERAAKAGKHVMCEKPMANTPEECERMIAVCREANVRLMVAYRCQYEPHHREVRRLARSGELGAVKLVEATNGQNQGNPDQWRLKRDLAGGGALPDVGLYCLNTVRFVLAEEPLEVYARAYSTPNDPRFAEVEESVAWTMRFPSGILANCFTSYGHHEARRYRLYAERGWFGLDPAFPYRGLRLELGRALEGGGEVREERRLPEKNQFTLELDHFSRSIQENLTPFTPGEEGLQDVKIMAAIYESARENRPIALERVEGKDAFRGTEPG